MLQMLGLGMIAAGIISLRVVWQRRGRHSSLALAGWLLIVGGFVAASIDSGAEVGIAYASVAISICAYLVIAATHERRAPRKLPASDRALEPEQRRVDVGRAVAKSLLAIGLSGLTAIGIGVAFAVAMPMQPQDRIIVGGLLVPLLWGGGMAWTLSDPKLLRAAVLLTLVSIASYATAFLWKVLQ